MNKYFANRGVPRNKKPLKNIIYEIELLKSFDIWREYDKYKFKDLGYLVLYWSYKGDSIRNWHGFITPEDLKEKIGLKQWNKFCQGKRKFIIQRRIDHHNIKIQQ